MRLKRKVALNKLKHLSHKNVFTLKKQQTELNFSQKLFVQHIFSLIEFAFQFFPALATVNSYSSS